MPNLADPASAPPARALIIGDSGTGKTGGLASLALAGFHLHIADFDNGMEILRNALRKDPSALARVDFEVCRDAFEVQGNNTVPKAARAWSKGLQYLESCLKKDLGPQDILITDSLSFAAKAALLQILHLNNRLKSPPWPGDWGEAQRLVENLLGMICSADVKCHIICTAHIAQTGGQRIETIGKGPDAQRVLIDEGPIKRLPSMVGKAINPIVPRYFNHMIQTYRQGNGPAAKYTFRTVPQDDIELKNTNPGTVKPEYPVATGLADYFRDVGISIPGAKAPQPGKAP